MKKEDSTLLYAGIALAAMLLINKKKTENSEMAGIGYITKSTALDMALDYGIDFHKDFYEQKHSNIGYLNELRKECGYNYQPTNGRTSLQAFYDSLKKKAKAWGFA